MASVDLDAKAEGEETPPQRRPAAGWLAWAPSVGPAPLGFGWDAEPLVVDWFGGGRPDLLVSAGGGPRGRRAGVFRAPPAEGEASAAARSAGDRRRPGDPTVNRRERLRWTTD